MRYATLTAALFLTAFGSILPGRAQNAALIHHTIVKSPNTPPAMGRDFWFAVPSNEWGMAQLETYIQIYITSPVNTTAYVESNGSKTKLNVAAYSTTTFTVPKYWEVESSGIWENKAIHVYSNDADLTVYFMSHQFQSGDGSYIIPTIGWGTDYVVAAYGSLFAGSGKGEYDLPSECVVVANQDNTSGTITPLCDCRQCEGGNIYGDASSTIVVYPANQPIPFQLNRGQCMQLMPVKATDADNYDMSGTVIHANQPVGVLGASMDANIPNGYPNADFVCTMIPPVRTWGETYYAMNPLQPPGSSNDYARYLFISSKPGQTIFKYNCNQGNPVECVIDAQYGIYWDELEAGERFTSDAPFLVVWYMNSASYPGPQSANGDPAMCILPPREQFNNRVIFETPPAVHNTTPYTNYVNIICRNDDAIRTLFDNNSLLGQGSLCLDSSYEVFVVYPVQPGLHTATGGNSGIGVYLYGYGYNNSYAWSTGTSVGTLHSWDTIPPILDTAGICTSAFIHISDSGLLPDGIHKQSGLSMIRLDSAYNMQYILEEPNFVEGSGDDSSGYGMYVIDPSKPATLIVEVYDVAGNRDSITSIYQPQEGSIEPPLNNLGTWHSGGSPNISYDTIYNHGTIPLKISSIKLKYGNVGFSLMDSAGGSVDLSPIPPGKFRLIRIEFVALVPTRVVDTILIDEGGCFSMTAAVAGSGGAADFLVTDQTWPNELLTQPTTCYTSTVKIENLSQGVLTIDSAYIPDPHFSFVPGQFPIVIQPSPAFPKVNIIYCPDSGSLTIPNHTTARWFSKQVAGGEGSPRFDSLTGWAIHPSATFTSDVDTTFACAPQGELIIFPFYLTSTGTAPITIKRVTQTYFVYLYGEVIGTSLTWDPQTTSQTLLPGQTAVFYTQYNIPSDLNATVVDSITAIDGNGDIIGGRPLTATVHVSNLEAALSPTFVDFGTLPFRTQAPGTTQSFTIQNTGNVPLPIENLLLEPGDPYNTAFTFTTIPPVTFPDTLPAGQSLLVSVDFNDSISSDPTQSALMEIVTETCDELTEALTASIAGSGVTQTAAPSLHATIVPAEDGRSLTVTIPPATDGPVQFELVNVLGQSVLRNAFGAGTQTVEADALSRGVYFYRLTSGAMSQSGKVILGE